MRLEMLGISTLVSAASRLKLKRAFAGCCRVLPSSPVCMPGATTPSICAVCTRRLQPHRHLVTGRRPFSLSRHTASAPSPQKANDGDEGGHGRHEGAEQRKGAMTRKLEQLSEEALESGGRSGRKFVQEAGFSQELKEQLERKIADADFRSENAAALAQANMPTSAPKHAREIAAAKPWSGKESVEDASLRMLNDAHKPLRVSPRTGSSRIPKRVDTGRSTNKPTTGARLANARDKASVYEDRLKGMTDEEREKFRQDMKARFQPHARAVATVQGLASLANERIEDAIARGQFKNLPNRGKKIERDYNASSPFIDTTAYLLNGIIKRQDIVPPWIEKQQEVLSTATTFRKRLRSDWKRHVSRMIASRGGSVDSQLKLAEEYAFAESLENPSKQHSETMNAVDKQGHLSQITIAGELKPATEDDDARMEEEIKVLEQSFNDDGTLKPPEQQVIVSTTPPDMSQQPPPPPARRPTVPPFRDPQWEKTELSYHTLAIQELNALTRSYNLMAPNLAKKPYFSLDRELQSCFAEVAPQVSAAIRERAFAPKVKGVEVVGHKAGSLLNKFSMDSAVQVYEERKPRYGFKEFWRDLFAPAK